MRVLGLRYYISWHSGRGIGILGNFFRGSSLYVSYRSFLRVLVISLGFSWVSLGSYPISWSYPYSLVDILSSFLGRKSSISLG